MRGLSRPQPVLAVGRSAVQREGVVGDIGDREGTIAGRGEQLTEALLNLSAPPRILAGVRWGCPRNPF